MAFNQSFFSTLILSSLVTACSNPATSEKQSTVLKSADYVTELVSQRMNKNKEMISEGVIEENERAGFKGLNYFEVDSMFRISAKIDFLDLKEVVFKTNTERSPVYYEFCKLSFKLGDSLCVLTAYADSKDAISLLFIPFRDKSNKSETYGGGRYIETNYKGELENLELDFNNAFNPYCHYNHTYSCPLVPAENHLKVAITAGEKKYHE